MSEYISLTNGLLFFIIAVLFKIAKDVAKFKEHIKACPHVMDIFKE